MDKVAKAAAYVVANEVRINFPTLEDLLCEQRFFGLTTATPLQRAVCRIIGGDPLRELGEHPDVIDALGCSVNCCDPLGNGGYGPREVMLLAAIRGAKSMLAAAIAIRATQIVDLSATLSGGGEIPRYSVLSLELDNAKDVHKHLVGALMKPALRCLVMDPEDIIDDECEDWAELIKRTGAKLVGSEFLWHPSGRPVEIRVVAGKRAGGSLLSKWSAGCTLDEAPRMIGSSEGVVNLDDARRGVLGRLLPGAQLFMCGSPWRSYGPVYEISEADFGSPTKQRVVIKGKGPKMNPTWWTEARCEEMRLSDPMAYKTDVLAEFIDADEQLYSQDLIEQCIRDNPLIISWERGHDYWAGMDPATRTNTWALVITDRVGIKKRVVLAAEWVPTKKARLNPRTVMKEVAEILKSYRLDSASTDEWAADALKTIAEEEGITLIEEPMARKDRVSAYTSLATEMSDGRVELPNDPHLRKDMKFIRRRAAQTGPDIVLIKTPDGRHADYGAALIRSIKHFLDDVDQDPAPPEGTVERMNWDEKKKGDEELEEILNPQPMWMGMGPI